MAKSEDGAMKVSRMTYNSRYENDEDKGYPTFLD